MTTPYLDTYFSRINHLGDTTAERIRNGGIRSFQKWMAESPHTVRQLSVERGLYFDGIILTSKDKEYEKIMFLNVANNIPLQIGDIMNWMTDEGKIEKWLITQEERKVNGTYRTFWIVRCNYFIKWVDALGHLQSSWCYFVSSLDSKIKGNFRTWHSLITPQPNKYAEILLPRREIDRATNFIVEDESWTVVEYDHTSVPGVIYLSLTEGKVNEIYDDLVEDIADTDKLAVYEILEPDLPQVFKVNEEIKPQITLTKNGIPYNGEIVFMPVNTTYTKVENGRLVAKAEGTTEIIVQLRDYPDIQKKISIVIADTEQEFAAYIEGPDRIRLDCKEIYRLAATSIVLGKVQFSFAETTKLAEILDDTDSSCIVHANDKNKLGTIVLQAIYGGKTYTKSIKIIPIW